MLHTFWSVKGGAGVTVSATAFAAASAADGPVTMVDLCGDLPTVLGLPATVPGVADWFGQPSYPVDALDRLVDRVTDRLDLLRRGEASSIAFPERVDDFVTWAAARPGLVVVDAGVSFTGESDPARDALVAGLTAAGRSWLVTRACYLSLRRATSCAERSDGIVMVDEPGHVLDHREVRRLLGRPLAARIEAEPSVSKAVDAGTLLRRRPRNLDRAVRGMR